MILSEEDARSFTATRCDDDAMERLEKLISLLAAENQRQNLIAAATVPQVWQRHIADSAQLLDHVPRETFSDRTWLDLGSGGGFPGLVIAAMRPAMRVTLVESRRLRSEWLLRAAGLLDLPRIVVLAKRLEDVPTQLYDVISARAFAPLPKVMTLATRFSTTDTTWLLPKGRSAAQEVASLPAALRRMFHVEQSATDAESGLIVGRIESPRK